jgi:hypothetical protein
VIGAEQYGIAEARQTGNMHAQCIRNSEQEKACNTTYNSLDHWENRFHLAMGSKSCVFHASMV